MKESPKRFQLCIMLCHMSCPPAVDIPYQELTGISVATIAIETMNSNTLSQIKF